MDEYKVCLVDANPFSDSGVTRGLDTYLSSFTNEQIFQICTNNKKLCKEKCLHYFRLTDKDVFRSRLHKNEKCGTSIELSMNGENLIREERRNKKYLITSILYSDSPFIRFLRLLLWNKKIWGNEKLKLWLDTYSPDFVFVHCSSSAFILEIAMFVSDYLHIPLIFEIADDYFFIKHSPVSLFNRLYQQKYAITFKRIMAMASGVIYLSDKMKNKYDSFFDKNGTSVYLSSYFTATGKQTSEKKCFQYFGNLGYGRRRTILRLGREISKYGVNIHVHLPPTQNAVNRLSGKEKGIKDEGSLEYEGVLKEMRNTDVLVYIETFQKKKAEEIELSLSTKISDYLASGIPILAVGSPKTGSISFLKKTKSAFVIDDKSKLEAYLKIFFDSNTDLSSFVKNAKTAYQDFFNLKKNQEKASELIRKVVETSKIQKE